MVYRLNRVHGLHLGSFINPTLSLVEACQEEWAEEHRVEAITEWLEGDALVDEDSTDEDMLASPDETTVPVDLPNGKIVGVFELRELLREGPG